MRRLKLHTILLILLTIVAGILALPREDAVLRVLGIDRELSVQQGLDLQGGAQLVYETDFSDVPPDRDRAEMLNNAVRVIERRIDPAGTGETDVRVAAGERLIVRLPGVEDVEDAKRLVGRTAQLHFLEGPPDFESFADFVPTGLTGEDVRRANQDFLPTTGQPVVSLELRSEARRQFTELTTRLNQSGGWLWIVLDDQTVFGPAQTDVIPDGRSTLRGDFDINEANEIADLIEGGALPVPIELESEMTVGATIGQEAIDRSLIAALIGLGSMVAFLVAYYRLAGVAAVSALGIYMALTLTIYKLSALTPFVIVLTLGGIAGFILSIAIAADANILILERTREEARRGLKIKEALEDGFDYAWTSIRDASAATIISVIILYVFGDRFGATVIQGFAVTLGIGVVLSLFSAMFISKTLLRLLVRLRFFENSRWVGIPVEEKQ